MSGPGLKPSVGGRVMNPHVRGLGNAFCFLRFIFYLSVCVFVHACICLSVQIPEEARTDVRSLGAGVRGSCMC